jgi:hypothetical protein
MAMEEKGMSNLVKLTYWLLVVCLFPAAALPVQKNGIEQFAWMLGTWKREAGDKILYESWAEPVGNTMLGEGYHIAKGDTVITEELRIQKIGNFWTYIPIVMNNPPVLFTLIESDKSRWVFENKEHDFPQRIVYSQKNDGSLLAWIEGEIEGKVMKEEYPMQRMK